MATVTLRDLHLRTGVFVSIAAEGHRIIVLKRGVPVAELRPVSSRRRGVPLPDRSKILARFPELAGDSGRFLEEDRR